MEKKKQLCKVCNKECDNGNERIFCMGPCHSHFHAKCVGFTPAPLKFYKSCSNLFYECDDCSENPTRMISETLNKLMSFMCILNERLGRQEANCELIFKHFEKVNENLHKYVAGNKSEINKNKMEAGGGHTSITHSYTETVPTTVTDPVVVIRPKKPKKCSETRAIIDEKDIPNQFAINSVDNLPNGGLKIMCKEKSDQLKLHKKAIVELGDDFTITIPSKRNPKIRITNMSQKRSDVEIVESIKNQIELTKEVAVKVIHAFDVNFNETYGAIVELDSKTLRLLMTKKTIRIGPDTCNVTECVSVLRCYKCCGYNHKASVCKNQLACLRCGGDHIAKQCNTAKSQCINCKRVAEKLKSNIDWNHPASSASCPILQKKMDRLRTTYA